MSRYAACIGVIAFAWGMAPSPSAQAGYYSSFDALEETHRYSRDYQVFSDILSNLGAIAAAKDPPVYTPIRQRYLLLEAMGGESPVNLKTLGQKLDYSAVLIRRARYEDAVQFLRPLAEEQPRNFLVLTHYATAQFLAPREFQRQSAFYMMKALDNWPKRWEDVKDEQKSLLATLGWHETDFDRYRRFEVYFDRLIKNRLKEDELLAQKKPVEEVVDPIFTDDAGKPIRFVNEAGAFEAGRIARTEFEKLPKGEAIEAVEQILIWMPHDQRLLWLLGEVFNASAMELKGNQSNDAIRNAHKIFDKLADPLGSVKFGLNETKSRRDALKEAVKKMPPPAIPEGLEKLLNKKDNDDTPPPEQQSWQHLIVAFFTGLAIGLFTLWQYQEMRRRRQARAQGS
jgi:hypothetical protein